MENASKALIMAGGVLVALMIIMITVYLVQAAGGLSQTYYNKLEQDRINAYNDKFYRFCKNINGQEMVTLINLMAEINEKEERKISLYISGHEVSNIKDISNNQNAIIEILNKTDISTTASPMYEFKSMEYYDDGYLKAIKFYGPAIVI